MAGLTFQYTELFVSDFGYHPNYTSYMATIKLLHINRLWIGTIETEWLANLMK